MFIDKFMDKWRKEKQKNKKKSIITMKPTYPYILCLLAITLCSCIAPLVPQYADLSLGNPSSWEGASDSFRIIHFSRDGSVVQFVWEPTNGPLEVPIISGIDTPIVAYPLYGVKPYGAVIPRGSFGSVTVELTPIDGWLCSILLSQPSLFAALPYIDLLALRGAIHEYTNPWNLQREQLIDQLLYRSTGALETEELQEITLYGLPSGHWVSDNELLNGKSGAMLARRGIPTVLPELPPGTWNFLHVESGRILQVVITRKGKSSYMMYES